MQFKKFNKKIILKSFFSFFLLLLIGCNYSNNNLEPEISIAKSNIVINIHADKSKTLVIVNFEEHFGLEVNQIEFNGKPVTQKETVNGRTKFTEKFNSFENTNLIVFREQNGKEHKFETTIEPIDFDVKDNFVFYRSKNNELKLSRPFEDKKDLWISIFDEYIGGVKEIAEFNEQKNTIVISKSVSKRMSVENAKISLFNSEKKEIDNDIFNVILDITYESEINIIVR